MSHSFLLGSGPIPGGVTPLEQLYRTVRARAPHARLLVTGYPLLFPTGAKASPRCDVIRPEARQAVNAATLRLNAAAAEGARGTGATYVDLVQPFAGPSSCEADPAASWINTVVPQDVVASFHPNPTGQRAIAGGHPPQAEPYTQPRDTRAWDEQDRRRMDET